MGGGQAPLSLLTGSRTELQVGEREGVQGTYYPWGSAQHSAWLQSLSCNSRVSTGLQTHQSIAMTASAMTVNRGSVQPSQLPLPQTQQALSLVRWGFVGQRIEIYEEPKS